MITIAGRPLTCLKCRNVGHIRRHCQGVSARRTYANTASGKTNDPISIFTAEKQADALSVNTVIAADVGATNSGGDGVVPTGDVNGNTGDVVPTK